MKQKEILLFGATGQIGRNLIRKLTKNNYKIIAVTRNIHRAGYILKTQANPGYLELIELKDFNINRIDELFKKSSICINLIGILYEKKRDEFQIIHSDLPAMLSKKANQFQLEKFIHLSALGIEKAIDSKYASSKLDGEKRIRENFHKSIIIKPSIVYSVDDKFTTKFMSLLSSLPLMPLYYDGKTKFSPIHVADLVDIIYNLLEHKKDNLVIECIGPDIITFKEIIQKLLISIDKKRILLPLPLPFAKLTAKFFQLFPNPLLTEDQLTMLKYDNCKSENYKNNFDLGYIPKRKFEIEINKYSYNWKMGGQYANNSILNKSK
tara:strand:+ start:1068 stop:2033 length:966 start_codon:yes stop_codon:yes gene_type:complete